MGDSRLTDSEINAAVAVLRSGALRQGKVCESLEREFAHKVGARHAVTASSGSAALHLAYMCFLKPGDEVLTPSFTFIATGSMVTMAGGRPVFCDVDPRTYLMDLEDAESKVTSRTRAVAPVHLFGNPCDVQKVEAFARKHDLIIVWDAAQAHGAAFGGRDIGACRDFVCYSFYPSKNMFVGEGGMICAGDDAYAEQLRFMRMHGQTGKYYHTMMGLNYRMTDVEAAIGLEQMKRLDHMLATRRRNAEFLNERLSGIRGIHLPEVTPGGSHAWHQYCVVLDPASLGIDRDAAMAKLAAGGVATAVHYPRGMHQQPVFEELYGRARLPVTERLSENILALPVHHGLEESDLRQIVECVAALAA